MRKTFLLFLILFLFSINFVKALAVDLYFFYSETCPFCTQAKGFLEELKKQYPNLNIFSFEIFYQKENRTFYLSLAKAFKLNLNDYPVPVIYINDKSFVGFDNYKASQIKLEVIKCQTQKCISPIEKLNLRKENQNLIKKKNFPSLYLIALISFLFLIKLILLFLRKRI
jgi:glutaredoxin